MRQLKVFVTVIIVIILILISLLFDKSYFVTSMSMNGSLLAGDVIIVKTLPAEIERNDIIVFKNPLCEKELLIKRCIAMPGDKIQINNSRIFINDSIQKLPDNALQLFKIWFKKKEFKNINILLKSIGAAVYNCGSEQNRGYFIVNLTRNQNELLNRIAYIDSISWFLQYSEIFYSYDFWQIQNGWTPINLGPVIIPGKEQIIPKNAYIPPLCERLIDGFRLNCSKDLDDSSKLKDFQLSRTEFKSDYYFMMGDNRSFSIDSRYWGLVPGNLFIGKTSLILLSIDSNEAGLKKIRWKRILKKL